MTFDPKDYELSAGQQMKVLREFLDKHERLGHGQSVGELIEEAKQLRNFRVFGGFEQLEPTFEEKLAHWRLDWRRERRKKR